MTQNTILLALRKELKQNVDAKKDMPQFPSPRPLICYTGSMSAKVAVMLGMIVGSSVGGYAPILIGISPFSFTSLLTSAIGGIIGIVIAYKLTSQ